jgi:fluoride exporter
MVIAVLVAVCGGMGAIARFGVDGLVQARVLGSYPLGTLIVNLGGSTFLGLLAGLHASHDLQLVAATATIGSYTTFSTWMLEAHRAAEQGQTRVAWWSVLIAIAGGLAAVALGRALGGAL